MKILFFTGTGNSLWVAKKFTGEQLSISKLEDDNIYEIESDTVGIVCPIYAGNIPPIVSKYLGQTTIRANYVFSIFTCGYGSGAAAYTMKKTLAKNKTQLNYAATLFMLDNYLPVYTVEDELMKLQQKDVEAHLAQIQKDISIKKQEIPQVSLLTRAMTAIFSYILPPSGVEKKFSVSTDCIGCGTCASLCPAGNITVTKQPTWNNHCEGCLSCAHNCPKGAIRLKGEKGSARYRHPQITVSELIKANGTR